MTDKTTVMVLTTLTFFVAGLVMATAWTITDIQMYIMAFCLSASFQLGREHKRIEKQFRG